MRTKASKPRPDDPEQSKLFIAKARELQADGQLEDSDKLMGRLAHTPPRLHMPSKPKSKRRRAGGSKSGNG